jgi:hypothetical protein
MSPSDYIITKNNSQPYFYFVGFIQENNLSDFTIIIRLVFFILRPDLHASDFAIPVTIRLAFFILRPDIACYK